MKPSLKLYIETSGLGYSAFIIKRGGGGIWQRGRRQNKAGCGGKCKVGGVGKIKQGAEEK